LDSSDIVTFNKLLNKIFFNRMCNICKKLNIMEKHLSAIVLNIIFIIKIKQLYKHI